MHEHFRAFTFVDRITSVEPGVRVRGLYEVPSHVDTFPASLVAEAVGQLAAWGVMSGMGFKQRPVAGIAAEIDLMGEVTPGQTLELSADLETVDTEAASYSGSASVEKRPIVRLQHCVGPMVPMEDYDDPLAVRERFKLLCGAGAEAGAFKGLPLLQLDKEASPGPNGLRANLRLPASAPFFADHFPRRPVFPGSLLMHANLQLVAELAAQIPAPVPWVVRKITDMKLRAFIPPGETVALEARLDTVSAESAAMVVESGNGKRMLGSARVLLTPQKAA